MELLTVLKECRACKSPDLEQVIDLGNQYVVDFVKEKGDQLQAPLTLVLCKSCGLLQMKYSVDKHRLYEKFWYRSGINEQMRKALKEIAIRAYASVDLDPDDLVLDIGCNDGTLLAQYPAFARVKKVGVDPAKELVQEAVDTKRLDAGLVGYFGSRKTFGLLQQFGKKFKIITSVAMFYDVEDPLGFLADCKELLHDDGVLIIQQNYLVGMLKQMAFDNICHEHLAYYSLTVMKRLLESAGLYLAGVETNDVNGGSFRVYITKGKDIQSVKLTHDFRLKLYTNELQLIQEEEQMRITSPDTYHLFEQRMSDICEALRNYLAVKMSEGKRVNVYGASTRGTTTMQCLDLPQTMLDHMQVAERDVHKFGFKMVGCWLPIVSEESLRPQTDIFLVLPFHFFEGIKIREKEFLKSGGEFVVPLPVPRVVTEESEQFLLEESVMGVAQ